MPQPPKPSPVIRDKAQIEAKYAITEDDVDRCREWLESSGWPDMVVKGFLKHLDADLVADAWCPGCNGRVKVRYPNYGGFKNVVQLASEYLLQKMADRLDVNVNVNHRNVIEMNPEERDAYKRQLLGRVKGLPPGPSAA